MVQKFKLSDNNYPEELHDCKTKEIYLTNNRLKFIFEKENIVIIKNGQDTYPYDKLVVEYLLDDNLLDDLFSSFVEVSFYGRNLFGREKLSHKRFSIKEFVEFIEKNKYNVNIFSQYYNYNKCLIEVILDKEDMPFSKWIEAEISLCLNEIIYTCYECKTY